MNVISIRIGKEGITVPEYYQQVESMPEDPEGSIPLMVQTENAMCLVMLQEIAESGAMPFDDPQSVIDGIHECLAEEQGLIEVGSGGNKGSRLIYSIVKTLKNPDVPEGVQYTLTLDKECGDKVIHAQGFFDEIGTTGFRDTMVFQLYANEIGFDKAMEDWSQDPYDRTFKRGLLRNKSELSDYDEMFPEHPLSMAREFAIAIAG